ncbi:MAG: hypothetical protein ACOX88_00595 [Christensenellales bacterium]|jgi:hypothetical protein
MKIKWDFWRDWDSQKVKKAAYIVTVCILALLIVYTAVTFIKDAFFSSDTGGAEEVLGVDAAQIIITAKDGFTDEPLEGTVIVIPEIEKSYVTDAEGKTPVITVPVLRDERYDKIQQMPWGEITIIAYKDGYVENALFHISVEPGKVRHGPNVMMFKVGEISSTEPLSLIEGPPRLWLNELVEKYRPKN